MTRTAASSAVRGSPATNLAFADSFNAAFAAANDDVVAITVRITIIIASVSSIVAPTC